MFRQACAPPDGTLGKALKVEQGNQTEPHRLAALPVGLACPGRTLVDVRT